MEKSQRMLALIGSFKLVKAVVLAAIGITIVLRGHNLGDWVHTLIEALKIDPGNHRVNALVERVAGVSAHTLHQIAFGTFLYAAVFATEGVGLLLRKRWAEYLTVVITASFLPFEIYEMVEKFTVVRLGAFALNVAIVVYLVWNLRRERAAAQHKEAPAPT